MRQAAPDRLGNRQLGWKQTEKAANIRPSDLHSMRPTDRR
jgi:hypothetical protein